MNSDTLRLKELTPAQKRALLQAAVAQRQQIPPKGTGAVALATAPTSQWIVSLAARPAAARRVICFPHGAAGAASFRTWPALLPPDIEPLAVQLPGREGHTAEPFASDLETVAEAIVGALTPLLDRPFVFYGDALGGAVAVATAGALRARGLRAPEALVLAGWPDRPAEVLDVPIIALTGRDDDGAAVDAVCRAASSGPARSRLGARAATPLPRTGIGLSLFFFSTTEVEHDVDKYRLVDAAVQFADRSGFDAVWLPERHFHPVGGLFPNPSVLAAAVAASTQRLRIRSGSVVLPLHDPMRVAEEWSVVDNLSGGRVDMGVVPGWNPTDYSLAPAAYDGRWSHLFEHLDVVRRLWRGDAITRVNGRGEEVQVRLHPRPLQPELPVWIATSANDDSFVRAGELGLNVLTALLIQPVDAFARRVGLYREARARAGHDPAGGEVTLMVQACVGSTDAEVRRVVREPFLAYMRSVQSLWKETVDALRVESAAGQDALLDMVFERYFQRSTLFGSLDTCLERAAAYARAGATELACMIDFGLPYEESMASLGWLDRLRAHLADAGRPAVTR